MKNKISGIYAIFRKCDDKCMYIGQSKNCEARIGYHLGGYSNVPIENPNDYYADIIEKHGFDSKEFRLSREAFWINVFEPEWNKMRDRSHCEETRQKMSIVISEAMKRPEVRQKLREANLGKHHSEEAKQKIGAAKKDKHWKLVNGKRVYY